MCAKNFKSFVQKEDDPETELDENENAGSKKENIAKCFDGDGSLPAQSFYSNIRMSYMIFALKLIAYSVT